MLKNELEKQELVKRIEAVGEVLTNATTRLVEQALKTCVVCDHWNQSKETCALNGLRPPARIIAFGCECFENEIPF